MIGRWWTKQASKKRSIIKDERGATLVEFGFVMPILMVLVMGVFDMAHTQYTSAMVNGAMQKAGRDLTLENAGSRQGAINQQVIDIVSEVLPNNATVELETLSHFDFSDIGQPEDFNDDNLDGICNNNELFFDMNDNGQWDPDRGQAGIGSARDAVLYTANVSYPRLFPMAGLIGLDEEVNLSGSTVLRNQPFDEQDRTLETGNC